MGDTKNTLSIKSLVSQSKSKSNKTSTILLSQGPSSQKSHVSHDVNDVHYRAVQNPVKLIPSHVEPIKETKTPPSTPVKKKKCTSLRCLSIWMTATTILFLAACAVCGFFLFQLIQRIDDQENSISRMKKLQAQQQPMKNKDGNQNKPEPGPASLDKSSGPLQNNNNQQNNSPLSTSTSQADQCPTEQQVVELKAKTDTSVFFSARFSDSSSMKLNPGQTVVYGDVITTLGGGYNSSDGIFTAPKDGFYRAELHAQSPMAKQATLQLKHNDTVVVAEVKAAENKNGADSASNSAIVRLNMGDTLKVVCQRKTAYLEGKYLNSFSVQLVWVEVVPVSGPALTSSGQCLYISTVLGLCVLYWLF